MEVSPPQEVTQLLKEMGKGDRDTPAKVIRLVMRSCVATRSYLQRERAGHTLQPTVIVH